MKLTSHINQIINIWSFCNQTSDNRCVCVCVEGEGVVHACALMCVCNDAFPNAYVM